MFSTTEKKDSSELMQCNGPGRVVGHRAIITSNGNPAGKLRLWATGIPAGRVGSGSNFQHGSGTGMGTGGVAEMLDLHNPSGWLCAWIC